MQFEMNRWVLRGALCFAVWAQTLGVSGASTTNPLKGTTWQLHAIQSMDDAQGTTKMEDPSRFTLAFGSDGRAVFRLDCNRGQGGYEVTPASDSTTGSLTFSLIAVTRALCPQPPLGEKVARDMAYVRSYLLKEGKLYLTLMADGGIYEWAPVNTAGTEQVKNRIGKPVNFAKGKSATVIRDRIVGPQYVDYQLRAGAGQRMTVSLVGSNGANYFNVLPPDPDGSAMAAGEFTSNRFDGLLPDDGAYTIRVFLMRSASRRYEASNFTLSVGITGAPLKPVSTKVDAVLAGTRYHARSVTQCEPAYSTIRECDVYVVRRGFDGTATVELRWQSQGGQEMKRRILFVKGEPTASDTSQAMTFTRHERGWRVTFNGDEHFEIPEPLVFGG